MDLADWWRRRRWVALLDLIDQLPAASRLSEAIRNDPDQAELIARSDSGEPWRPSVRDFDLNAVLLVEIRNAVGALVEVMTQGKGKLPPIPLPRTLADDLRDTVTPDWAEDLISVLTPHHSTRR